MRSFARFLGPAVVSLAASLLPAHASVLIKVNKSDQRMTVFVNGAEQYSWPVSTGAPGYDTPSGSFRPNRMDADHHSQEYNNAPMPHAIFFDDHGHAIHGEYEKVGRPVSHGCVRLSPAHAAELFSLVKRDGMLKTKVEIGGQTPTITAGLNQEGRPLRLVGRGTEARHAWARREYPAGRLYEDPNSGVHPTYSYYSDNPYPSRSYRSYPSHEARFGAFRW